MRQFLWALIGGVGIVAPVQAADPSGLWKPLNATYKIHSGLVADRTSATPSERMLTIAIDANAAKAIFDSLPPEKRNSCSGEKGDRERSKKGISCSYTAADVKTKEGPYRCWIGLNLKTGNTEETTAC